MPVLPDGFYFTVQVIDGPRVRVAIESVDGVAATDFAATDTITTEAELVALVETVAAPMAGTFIRSRSMQGWIDQNWPAPVVTPAPTPTPDPVPTV